MVLHYIPASNARTAKTRPISTRFEGELLLNTAASIAREQGNTALLTNYGRRLEISRDGRRLQTLELR